MGVSGRLIGFVFCSDNKDHAPKISDNELAQQ